MHFVPLWQCDRGQKCIYNDLNKTDDANENANDYEFDGALCTSAGIEINALCDLKSTRASARCEHRSKTHFCFDCYAFGLDVC